MRVAFGTARALKATRKGRFSSIVGTWLKIALAPTDGARNANSNPREPTVAILGDAAELQAQRQ
jgi:hypothetical protein